MAEQAAKSVGGAARAGQHRIVVEAAIPELDPTGPAFQLPQLVAFAHAMALPLLEPQEQMVASSRSMIKLLFASTSDATLAGATVLTTALPVSVLGHPSLRMAGLDPTTCELRCTPARS